uniref:Testican-3 n=1 Tax=Malurus cyaneus samueli TaxID=2593467 RepID=A0A8C5X499_9PASS
MYSQYVTVSLHCSFLLTIFLCSALVCVCAAAWCSPAAAAAGGRPDSGNFLDDKQWLTTISQYDKEVGQWNKFRDDDYFRTWSPGKPFDQGKIPPLAICAHVLEHLQNSVN